MSEAPEFMIRSEGPVSEAFLSRHMSSFGVAADFVRSLPYRRNANKEDPLCIFSDGCGTCGTKHALLKQLAVENNFEEVSLWTGIFRMHKHNTPRVAATLEKYGIEYFPEAHNYLKYQGVVFDYTLPFGQFKFIPDLLEEIQISSNQVTGSKVQYHKNYLEAWLENNTELPYTLSELWAIRETCIEDLSKT